MSGYTGGAAGDSGDGTTVIVDNDTPQTIDLTTATGVVFEAPAATDGQVNLTLDGLQYGDTVTIDTNAVFGAGETVTFTSASDVRGGTNNLLVLAEPVSSTQESVGILVDGPGHVAEQVQNGDFVFTYDAPCYRRGTLIRTPDGEIPVECLEEGGLVTLADGGAARIIWLGHRKLDCASHPNPGSIWPILVRQGAFADAVPARDLYLSPGHSVFVNGVLMQAEKLINGATILQVETDTVEYWHLELDSHAILLAEGLPAESYLDQGNRTQFINGGAFVEAHPDFRPKHWAETCAKLVFDGPEMRGAQAMLLARAAEMGHVLTQEDGLHVTADGKRIEPVELGGSRQAFVLPAGAQTISLRSRTFIPNQVKPANSDKRSLGIRVGRLQLDGIDIALDDQTVFAAGWHKLETQPGKPDARWTTGETPIPAKTRLIMIERAGRGHYWAPKEAARDNVVALFG